MRICLRDLTSEERSAVETLARSRTEPARRVERARMIWRASRGEAPPSIAAALGLDADTVRRRIHRFNKEGLAALASPRHLGLPFAAWTLDRLAAYLLEHKGIAMRRSRIDEILLREGLRWRRHETWFGKRVDPEFAEKRGGSRGSTPRRLRAASSSAWTRWGRSAPRAIWDTRQSGRTCGRQAGPSRRSTMAGAARATSSAPSVRQQAPPSHDPTRAGVLATGWPSWKRSNTGFRMRSSGSTPSPTT